MWTIRPSVMRLSAGFWRPIITGWELSLSRIGKTKKVLIFTADQGLDLLSAREIWTLWSITIPYQKNVGIMTLLRRAVSMENVPTMPQWFMAI